MTKQEQNQLFNDFWKNINKLCGSINKTKFKDLLFSLMFYYYISADITDYFNKTEQQIDLDFDYDNLSIGKEEFINPRQECIKAKGYFIYPFQLFNNVYKSCCNNSEELNQILNETLKSIEDSAIGNESEDYFSGIFFKEFNDQEFGKNLLAQNKLLIDIMCAIKNVVDKNQDSLVELFEFLIEKYMKVIGDDKNSFSTPTTVSSLLIQFAKYDNPDIKKIYDPLCGSGSLLLNTKKILNNEWINYYGEEDKIAHYKLAKMNMFMHNINYSNFIIKHSDALVDTKFKINGLFDVVISKIYSKSWEGKDNPTLINDERYLSAGALAPRSKADYAYIMHALYTLKTTGKAVIVAPAGIAYRMHDDLIIRKYLIENNFIETVISLQGKLFYGQKCVMYVFVLSKSKKDKNILLINAENIYSKDDINYYLSENDIVKIMNAYQARTNLDKLARLLTNDEIINNNYNLMMNQYFPIATNNAIFDIDGLTEKLDTIVKYDQELKQSIKEIMTTIDFSFIDQNVNWLPLWQLTNWDRRFKSVNREKQTKIIKVKSIKDGDLKNMNVHYGDVKLISGSDDFNGFTTDEIAGDNITVGEVIALPEGSPKVKYWNGKFINAKNYVATSSDPSKYNLKFIYFYLSNNREYLKNYYYIGTDIPAPDMQPILDMLIPIPDIKTQNKIVEILDKFNSLLSIGFPKEIGFYEQQYAYCCNKLLMFKNNK